MLTNSLGSCDCDSFSWFVDISGSFSSFASAWLEAAAACTTGKEEADSSRSMQSVDVDNGRIINFDVITEANGKFFISSLIDDTLL